MGVSTGAVTDVGRYVGPTKVEETEPRSIVDVTWGGRELLVTQVTSLVGRSQALPDPGETWEPIVSASPTLLPPQVSSETSSYVTCGCEKE